MGIVVGILIGFCLFLLWGVRELKKQINNIETHLGKMEHDLNMVSKTMENMHKHEKAKEFAKQILNG